MRLCVYDSYLQNDSLFARFLGNDLLPSVCLCVSVCVCVRQPRACPRHKLSRVQA